MASLRLASELGDEVRTEHIRRMRDKIVDRKEREKTKAVRLENYLFCLSTCLSVLLVIQFALNLAQTTVFADADKTLLGVLSSIASVNTFAIACLGKHAYNSRKKMEQHTENQRRWDKAEDAFVMELSRSLEDGKLTSEEHQKLKKIYTDAGDFLDRSMQELDKDDKIFLSYIKDERFENGSKPRHSSDTRALQGLAVQR